jgi:hypothetical protein
VLEELAMYKPPPLAAVLLNILLVVMRAAAPDPKLLRQDNIGKLVVEFLGWARFRSGALRHAQAIRVRTDKTARMCTL